MKKSELDEFVEQQLERFPDTDVIVHYERKWGDFKIVLGFFAWDGHCHARTTIRELREDGWEKADIKVLRDDAKRICIVDNGIDGFEVVDGKTSDNQQASSDMLSSEN